jgi:AcrR family transcriptional regulator
VCRQRSTQCRDHTPYKVLSTIYGFVYHDSMATASEPSPAPAASPTLRDRTVRAVRAEVSAIAMRLFAEQGFDKTTVDQIAAEAGMSRTSFFRYFATKEDLVLGHLDELAQRVQEALAARPEAEPVWQSLRRAFDSLIEETAASPEENLRTSRMLHDTPTLRYRQLGKQLRWYDLLAPEVARRLHIADDSLDPRPRALVAAALACLNAAAETWSAANGAIDLPTLLDQAMDAPAG